MARALAGTHGLFVVTNFFEHFDAKREKGQVAAVVKAAETVGVEHYIWSTLDDTCAFFDGLPEDERPPKFPGTPYYVPHFDAKAESNSFFPRNKTTFMYVPFYIENL